MSAPLPFADRRLLVCVGSGGVGKTTLAAAIGLREALAGRKVLVCTIDPARRLANSLGLRALDHSQAEVSLAALGEAGGQARQGKLFAMMLDLRRSWDELIDQTAKSAEQRDRIYANPFYQQLSSALAGSQEYAAVSKLAELARRRDYDLIVLDTPPTVAALDFLEAPNRLLDFLDNEPARLLLTPALAAGKVGLQVLSLGSGFVVKSLSRFTGIETLRALADFMLQLSGMYDGFKARALEVKRLLSGPDTGFALVTSPNPATVDEALAFSRVLRAAALPLRAVIANRVNPFPTGVDASHRAPEPPSGFAPLAQPVRPGVGAEAIPQLSGDLGRRFAQTLADATGLATRDAAQLRRLAGAGLALRQVPVLAEEVFDLHALRQVGDLLALS